MAVPCVSAVSAPNLISKIPDGAVLKTVDGVVSKLELSPPDKQKFLPQISEVVGEAIFQRLSEFSEATKQSLLKGEEEIFNFALFMIIAFYVGGDKKNERLPGFLENIFDHEKITQLDIHRMQVRYGARTCFSLYGSPDKIDHKKVYQWGGLDAFSSKEAIASLFADPYTFDRNCRLSKRV